MKLFHRTWPTPEENLACDEALLIWCEAGGDTEILRFWEPSTYCVVLGYSNVAAHEANLAACREHNVPVLRRNSGGGTVLQGPGCLNYSLLLRIENSAPTANVIATNSFIMERHRKTLEELLSAPVKCRAARTYR